MQTNPTTAASTAAAGQFSFQRRSSGSCVSSQVTTVRASVATGSQKPSVRSGSAGCSQNRMRGADAQQSQAATVAQAPQEDRQPIRTAI